VPDSAIVIEYSAAALVGASIGAFAATAAIRLTDGRNPWRGRSCCDQCQRRLSVLETLPMLGYLMSQGKCRTCHGKIDPLHIASEALGLMLLPLCLWLRPGIDGVLLGALAMALLTTAIVDLRTYRLLDVFTVPIAALSAIIAWREHQLIVGIIAAVVTVLILIGLKVWLDRRSGKAMLGYGDVKLISALALMLGDKTPDLLVVASIIGLGIGGLKSQTLNKPVPFGPHIFFGFLVIVLVKHFLPHEAG
jgi:prepilin signal peptidase PulO-like enzyme (type II secretory pathway)